VGVGLSKNFRLFWSDSPANFALGNDGALHTGALNQGGYLSGGMAARKFHFRDPIHRRISL
jgi:hypothetical protein